MVARKAWIGGNWKCNGTLESIRQLGAALNKSHFTEAQADVVIFPTALHYAATRAALDDKFIVGTQNLSRTGNGAYTGEISVEMAADAGVTWTLIGHSERRSLYGESDEITAEKLEHCQNKNIKVAFCIGETLEEREKGQTDAVCARQISAILAKVKDWDKIVIAYEPVWAIGTGKVATKEQAQEAHQNIRNLIKQKVSPEVAEKIRIVYGGSVNDTNCGDLASMPDIDGFLVGGASLKPSFTTIIETAIEKQK